MPLCLRGPEALVRSSFSNNAILLSEVILRIVLLIIYALFPCKVPTLIPPIASSWWATMLAVSALTLARPYPLAVQAASTTFSHQMLPPPPLPPRCRRDHVAMAPREGWLSPKLLTNISLSVIRGRRKMRSRRIAAVGWVIQFRLYRTRKCGQ